MCNDGYYMILLLLLLLWHQASMVNLASVKDGAFNDNGIPGLRGIVSSALTAIQPESTGGANNFRFYTSTPKLRIGCMEA